MSIGEYVEKVCQHNFLEFRIFRSLDSCHSVDILKTYDQTFLSYFHCIDEVFQPKAANSTYFKSL